MKRFELSEWLANTSRKVVTRNGRPARIICWDRQCELKYNYPVLALVLIENTEVPVISNKEGRTWNNNEVNDLFFADEEVEHTEFEKELEMMMVSFSNENLGSDIRKEIPKQKLHNYANRLLDLARKELKKDWRTPLRLYKRAYEQGKKDALKDLPKWKKVDSNPPKVQYNLQGKRLYKDGEYYIELIDLEILPKEEQL